VIRQCIEGDPAGARLTLVVAPAGFGKTTLLGEIRGTLEARGFRTAWLNCDERDREPRALGESIARALQHAGVPVRGTLRSPEDLARKCAQLHYPLALLIDEFDLAACERNEAALESLARTAPDNLRVIVAARSLPRRPIVALELDGCVRLIDASVLRFSDSESRAFLEGLGSASTLGELVARAEGWPFVLQLLRLHARRHAPGATGDAGLVLPGSRISEYLASEVTSRLDPDLREFVIETALLPAITIEDAIAITGRDDSAALLRRLEPLVPIVTLDHNPVTARFHPLFRDHLLTELDTRGRAYVGQLHERVARQYERTQRVFEAVRCAVAGGLIDLAVAILERAGGVRYVLAGGLTESRRTLNLLPRPAIEQNLRLRLMTVGTMILKERGDDAPRELAAIEAELQEGHFEGQLDETAEVDLATARSLAGYFELDHTLLRPDWDALHEATRRAGELARNDPRLWVSPLVLEILLLMRQGAFARAEPLIDAYIALNEQDGRFHTAADAWIYRGLQKLARGELDEAELVAGRALTTLLNRDGHEEAHSAQFAHALMGQIRYLRNDIRGAVAHFDALPTQNAYVTFEVYAAQHVWRALCDVAAGDPDSALDRLDVACAQAADRMLPQLEILADAMRRDLQARGDGARTRSPAATAELPADADLLLSGDVLPWYTRAWLTRARVSILAAHNRHAEAVRAAEAFVAATAESGRRLLKAEAWLLLARASAPLEARSTTQGAVQRALQLTAGTGAYRLFLDAGADVAQCVCEIAGSSSGPASEWAREIVSRMTPMDRLSARQKDVLRELCKGQSNKEIARVLQLSPETVKWYLKGIFDHFGLASREAVIEAANRAAGLPPPAAPPDGAPAVRTGLV
jgi:ATP/maltotriose-dependent transcriptional regulator MalT